MKYYVRKYIIVDSYKIDIEKDNRYWFESIGPHGVIRMCGRFELSAVKNIYQFEFGIHNPVTDDVDTRFRANNADKDKIISTIFNIILMFLSCNKDAIVRFSGSTESRTKLFRMWILNNWDLMNNNFIMYGNNEQNRWERYQKNKDYSAILLKI